MTPQTPTKKLRKAIRVVLVNCSYHFPPRVVDELEKDLAQAFIQHIEATFPDLFSEGYGKTMSAKRIVHISNENDHKSTFWELTGDPDTLAKIESQDAMRERVHRAFRIKPRETKDWDICIKELIEHDKRGFTVERFVQWNSDDANKYKALSEKQIINKPTALSDMVGVHGKDESEEETTTYFKGDDYSDAVERPE